MSKFYVILLLACLIVSCKAQTQTQNFEWKEYTFDDAGIKIKFPCEPERKVIIGQDKPKLARNFGFKCDNDGVTFVVEVVEHLNKLDDEKMKQTLNDAEKELRAMVGQKNNFESKSFLYKDKLNASIINITNSTIYWRHTNIIDDKKLYRIMVFFRKKEWQSENDFNNEFEDTYKKFFDSFQIIEK